MQKILLYCSFIAAAIAIYFAFQSIRLSNQRQNLSYDLAELLNIKYGLLNADLWKEKAAAFLQKKIESFSLDADNRALLKKGVEYGLYRMADQLDSLLKAEKNSADWQNKLKSVIKNVALPTIDLRSKVPIIAESVMQELDKDAVQNNLKIYLNKQVEKLQEESDKTVISGYRDSIIASYDCNSPDMASSFLQNKISNIQSQLWSMSVILLICILAAFLSWIFSAQISWLHYSSLVIISFTILTAGVSTPMIDIDARILSLNFRLLDEEIGFKDQILFYQSKSILDVTYLLLFKGDLQTSLIGLLILIFSIVFPVSKLIASAFAYRRVQIINNNPIMKFLVLKSAKWSMADVMVVAIFMAFIGFNGLLKSQLGQLENNRQAEILTTHQYSGLQPGFLLFTIFCLASLFLALFMEKRLKNTTLKIEKRPE
jgi:hypothetical protein